MKVVNGKNYITMKINIEVNGSDPEIKEFLELLAKFETLGTVGVNRTIPVVYDGDGSARLQFEAKDPLGNDLIEEYRERIRSGGKLNMDEKNFMEQLDHHVVKEHYIGE